MAEFYEGSSNEEKRPSFTDSRSLKSACKRFGRKSSVIKETCDSICKDILSCSPSFIHVLAVYKPLDEYEIIFIVFTQKGVNKPTRLPKLLYTFKVEFRELGMYSDENKQVMEYLSKNRSSFTENKRQEIESVLQSTSTILMEKHQHLNILSACPIKSIDYGKSNGSFIYQACIVLYVEIKGFIPLQEDEFPRFIKGIPVDVREMGFEFYAPKANEYNPTLKMGCLIGCAVGVQGQYKIGTLGAFVDLPGGHVGCITSAHVVLNDNDMKHLIDNKVIEKRDNKILQPVPCLGPHFGHMTKAVYSNGGGDGEIGVEAAFILITDPARIPESGHFPDGDYTDTGFSPSSPMTYTSGDIYTSIPEKSRHSTVYKYGSETLLTRGAFDFHGPSVRTNSLHNTNDSFGICLHKQIQMLSVGPKEFAKNGDSGALVLVPHNGNVNDLRAIGILTGGSTDGTLYFVTPIWGILKALDQNANIKLKTFSDRRSCVGACAMDTEEATEPIEDSLQNLHLYGRSGTATEGIHSANLKMNKQLETHTNQLREIKLEQSEVQKQFTEFQSDIKKQLRQTKTDMEEVVQKTIDDKLDLFLNKLSKRLP